MPYLFGVLIFAFTLALVWAVRVAVFVAGVWASVKILQHLGAL
jgi:hypothetical protein